MDKMNIILMIFLILFSLIIGVVLYFVITFQIRKVKENRQGWRTRPRGRDAILYQQKIDNKWSGIEIDGEMLIGKIIKVIYFRTQEEWKKYPEWAQNREEIIMRVKLNYPSKWTEYENA